MKINITKKQYETLLKMVQYGFWVTSAKDEDPHQRDEFSEMEQYLMSFAKDFDFEGVEYDSQYQVYDLTVEQEEEIHQVIDQYEDMVLWDKLAYYLARRDFAAELTEQELSEEEAFNRLIELEEEYHLHFEKHGLQHIKIEK